MLTKFDWATWRRDAATLQFKEKLHKRIQFYKDELLRLDIRQDPQQIATVYASLKEKILCLEDIIKRELEQTDE